MPKKHIEKPRVPIMGDRGALLSIQSLLSGKEWNSEDLETVAEFCRLAGYRIDPPPYYHDCPNCRGHREDEGSLASELTQAVEDGRLGERDAMHILGYEGDG